ncbi:DUF1003 domain-containing protein [Desertivirga arenae]|uniref:DUF1003 domain-containing protein n=1 Tax=Desertivirga arenae TaxID=2810309 RepID=UPI001A957FEE|nr:DUF1003 domain-containing protein [Pedobacter sp. SYSU D00823]
MENDNQKLPPMASVVERNIKALLEREKNEEAKESYQDKIADKITKFTGSMLFVYIHFLLIGLWILWNVNLLGLKPFDPSFVILAMAASVEAIFLSTFVLISQNRAARLADKRAELELQVNLLAEHEITKLIAMVSTIARKLDIQDFDQKEIEDLAKDVHPEKVLDFIEGSKKNQEK